MSFQAPKLIFFLPETGIYSNQWEVVDIGLDPEFLMNTKSEFELIGKNEVLPMYIPREKFSHKGTYGHSLIVGGSYGKIGAVSLAANACLNVGSGLVTTYVPKCGFVPIQASLPEVMVITDEDENHIHTISFDITPSVIGIGVGLGVETETANAFSKFLDTIKAPLVIDADGLNIVGQKQRPLKKVTIKNGIDPSPQGT